MKFLFLVLMFTLASCGQRSTLIINKEIPGPEVVIDQFLEGYYYLNNNSSIELTASEDGDITIESTNQFLTSINPENDTLGTHPRISGKYEVHNNEIRIVRNYTYTAGGDLEEDVNGSNIVGSRQTSIIIKKSGDGIKITIHIYSAAMNDNVNSIVATRVFKGD